MEGDSSWSGRLSSASRRYLQSRSGLFGFHSKSSHFPTQLYSIVFSPSRLAYFIRCKDIGILYVLM